MPATKIIVIGGLGRKDVEVVQVAKNSQICGDLPDGPKNSYMIGQPVRLDQLTLRHSDAPMTRKGKSTGYATNEENTAKPWGIVLDILIQPKIRKQSLRKLHRIVQPPYNTTTIE